MSQSPYARKIDEFRQLLAEHNGECPNEDQLDVKAIIIALKKIGGTTDRGLRKAKYEHLTDIGIPRMLAEVSCEEIFRDKVKKTRKEKPLTVNRVAALSFVELFKRYDPTGEAHPAVRDRLLAESNGLRCVVFDPKDHRTILVSESVRILRDIKDGLPDQDIINFNGKPCRVYKVGDRPAVEALEENFLYPGQLLRDNMCTNTNRSVVNIPFEARQIVYLAITNTGELKLNDIEDAHHILDVLECNDAISKVQARYSRAAILLQELKLIGEEPKLRVPKGGHKKDNNPFNIGKHVST